MLARGPGLRSLWALGALASGYLIARTVGESLAAPFWLALAFAALVVAGLSRGRACKVSLLVAVLALSGGWFTLRVIETPQNSLARLLNDAPLAESELVRLEGMVEDWPLDTTPPSGALGRFARTTPGCVFTLTLRRAIDDAGEHRAASGRVWVRVDAPASVVAPIARPGAMLRVAGRITPVRRPMNPGEADWLLLAHQSGRVGSLRVPSAELLVPIAAAGLLEKAQSIGTGALGTLRRSASGLLAHTANDAEDAGAELAGGPEGQQAGDSSIPPREPSRERSRAQARALLGAMLLGERSPALEEVNNAFLRLGLVHLVAISGFNLVVMSGVALFLVRLASGGGGGRGVGWLEPTLIGILIALYMLVLPAQAPILRAGLIALVFLAAEASGRRYHRLTLLGWVAIVVLVVQPLDLWSLSFQLSFGVVASLLVLGDRMHERLFGVEIHGVLKPAIEPGRVRLTTVLASFVSVVVRALKAQLSASVVAWLVATPIVIVHSGIVSPLSVLTSMVVLPLTVVVLWAGYTGLLLAALLWWVPGSGGVTSWCLDALARFLVEVVMTLDRVPGASFALPRVSVLWGLAAVAWACWWMWRGRARSSHMRRRDLLVSVLVLAWLATEVLVGPRLSGRAPLRIDTLSVGDGSCSLLRSRRPEMGGWLHEPEALLWDCGSLSPNNLDRRVREGLRALGAWRIDTMLITHAHLDHYAGAIEVSEALGIKRLLISPQIALAASSNPQSPIAIAIEAMRSRGVEIRTIARDDEIHLGVSKGLVLWPEPDRAFRDPNDASIVARFSVPTEQGERHALMTGDISREGVPSLLQLGEAGADLQAEVLELPHHGAFLESGAELVRVVNPSVVLQSTGVARARDRRWEAMKSARAWFVTCVDGASSVTIDDSGTVGASRRRR